MSRHEICASLQACDVHAHALVSPVFGSQPFKRILLYKMSRSFCLYSNGISRGPCAAANLQIRGTGTASFLESSMQTSRIESTFLLKMLVLKTTLQSFVHGGGPCRMGQCIAFLWPASHRGSSHLLGCCTESVIVHAVKSAFNSIPNVPCLAPAAPYTTTSLLSHHHSAVALPCPMFVSSFRTVCNCHSRLRQGTMVEFYISPAACLTHCKRRSSKRIPSTKRWHLASPCQLGTQGFLMTAQVLFIPTAQHKRQGPP